MYTKPVLLILFLVLISLLFASFASAAVNATNFSVSDLGLTGSQDIQLYANGVLQGTYNTSSNAIPLPDKDFIIVIKPTVKNQDLPTWLWTQVGVLKDNAVVIIILFGVIILATRRW